jgi:chondroitin AC lyase
MIPLKPFVHAYTNNMNRYSGFSFFVCLFMLAFRSDNTGLAFVKENYRFAQVQLNNLLAAADSNSTAFPRSTGANGRLVSTNMYDWTSGFFPGNLWYTYEYTHDKKLEAAAIRWTEKLEPVKNYTQHHDLGFMMYCSYGNAYRLTGNKAYKAVLVQAARSLSTRFNPTTGSIKSWNSFDSWHGNKKYTFPVIIDNMMNLELLFFGARASGDTGLKHIAVTHALTAMKNQVRLDFSTYHVVCYDTATGAVLARETAQGYADNSTWSRGQAWGIYGFTMVYRETKDPRFLRTAEGMADWFLHNPRLPADKIPYWDFNAGEQGYTPGVKSRALQVQELKRDASAAAIVAAALFELSTYAGSKGREYYDAAVQILHSLAGSAYRAAPGSNGNFLLQHSVGSLAHGFEVDVPLVYADYYFLEALQRYNRLLKGQPPVQEVN